MAVDTRRQQTHCSDMDSASLGPPCHYNTIRCAINIPHTNVSRKEGSGGGGAADSVVVVVVGGSISGPDCENHKVDVIKQKCLGICAERRMLNRGGQGTIKMTSGTTSQQLHGSAVCYGGGKMEGNTREH